MKRSNPFILWLKNSNFYKQRTVQIFIRVNLLFQAHCKVTQIRHEFNIVITTYFKLPSLFVCYRLYTLKTIMSICKCYTKKQDKLTVKSTWQEEH